MPIDFQPVSDETLDFQPDSGGTGGIDFQEETVGPAQGLINAGRRGIVGAQTIFPAALTAGLGPARPTMRQERGAFVSAMEDPRYMEGLMEAGDDPRKLAITESLLGPARRLDRNMENARAIREIWAGVTAEFAQERNAIPKSVAQQALAQAQGPGGKWDVFKRFPGQTVASIVLESLPPSLAGATVGTAVGGPGAGTAYGVGLSSLAMEFSNEFLAEAQRAGFDPADGEQLTKFLNSPKYQEAFDKALTRGIIVGGIDGATAGAAGRFIEPALKQGLFKVVQASGKEVGMQAAGGAGGELVKQLATRDPGAPIDWFDVAMEGVAEIATGPAEVVGNIRAMPAAEKPAPAVEKPAPVTPASTAPATPATQAPPADTSPEALADLQAVMRGERPESPRLRKEREAAERKAKAEQGLPLTPEQAEQDEQARKILADRGKDYSGMNNFELELLETLGDGGARSERKARQVRKFLAAQEQERQQSESGSGSSGASLTEPAGPVDSVRETIQATEPAIVGTEIPQTAGQPPAQVAPAESPISSISSLSSEAGHPIDFVPESGPATTAGETITRGPAQTLKAQAAHERTGSEIPAEGASTLPQPSLPTPQATPTPATPRRPRAMVERGHDLIDEIEGEVGKIDPRLIRQANPHWKPRGAARKIFKAGGVPADRAIQALAYGGAKLGVRDDTAIDEFGDLLNQVADGRKRGRERAARERAALEAEAAEKTAAELQDLNFKRKALQGHRPKRDSGNVQQVHVDHLVEGDTFKVQDQKFTVEELEFDADGSLLSVTVKDGPKFGVQEVDGTEVLNIDKGTLRRKPRPESAGSGSSSESGIMPDPGEQPFSVAREPDSGGAGGMDYTDVKLAVRPLREAMPGAPGVVIVETQDELPQGILAYVKRGQRVRATVFNGQVWLVAENLRNADMARAAYLHEVLGHQGLRAVLRPEELRAFLESVARRYEGTEQWREIERLYRADRLTHAEEIVARVAEGGIEDPSLWRRIVAAVRAWWRRVGGPGEVNEADIRAMLARARRALGEGRGEAATSGESFSLGEDEFSFDAPESVEEQKARLAREKESATAKAREQSQREELARRRDRRLAGDLGEAGQGNLFAEPGQQEMFRAPAAEGQAEQRPLFSLNRRPEKEYIRRIARTYHVGEFLESYFTPGRIVPSYGGGRDRVIAFNHNDPARGGWSVTVQEIDKEGQPVDEPRNHSTYPSEERLVASGILKQHKVGVGEIPNVLALPRGPLGEIEQLELLNEIGERAIDPQHKVHRETPYAADMYEAAHVAELVLESVGIKAINPILEYADHHRRLNGPHGSEHAQKVLRAFSKANLDMSDLRLWLNGMTFAQLRSQERPLFSLDPEEINRRGQALVAEIRRLREAVRNAPDEDTRRDLQDELYAAEAELDELTASAPRHPGGIPLGARAVVSDVDGNLTPAAQAPSTAPESGGAGPPAPVPAFEGPEKLPPGRLRDLFTGLRAWRQKTGDWLARRGAREVVTYRRDAGDNAAGQAANESTGSVRLILNRAFGSRGERVRRKHELREYALTFVIEADGQRGRLAEFHNQIADSEHADTKHGRRALAAIRFADANWDRFADAVGRYRMLTEAEREIELNEGVNSREWEGGYVMHQWRKEASGGADPTSPVPAPTPFRKRRTVATYAEGIAAGKVPITLNALENLASRIDAGQKRLNELRWLHGLRSMTDPVTDEPLVVDVIRRPRRPVGVPRKPTRAEHAAGPDEFEQATPPEWETSAPPGYKLFRSGDVEMAIQEDFHKLLVSLTAPSFSKGAPIKKVLGAMKSTMLLFDTFHLGRMAAWRSMFGIGSTDLPGALESLKGGRPGEAIGRAIPGHRKGETLLDYTESDIRQMAERGEIPAKWADGLVENKRRLDLAIKSGFNVGNVLDNAWGDALHHLPGIGTFNKWLFGQYQRGAMAEAWLIEFERMSRAMPNAPEQEVARRVSKDLNARFGNLNRQGLFKSRTAQDLVRFVFLAPQWNESLIRSELGALRDLVKLPFESVKRRRLVVGTLLRSTGTMALGTFLANQVLNFVFRGKPTWENDEEGWDKKLSAWIPDVMGNGPGFFLNPLALPAEYTHLIDTQLHKSRDSADAFWRILNSRLHSPTRAAMMLATRKDVLGRSLKPGEVLPAMGNALIPAPIPTSTITSAGRQLLTGESSERFPGQYQKQAMASFGIKTDQAPSPEQRIRNLARAFNADKGITPSAEFYTGDFDELTKALRLGNMTDARAALEDLLEKKTPRQVYDHFVRWTRAPYTGQRAREAEFLRGLTPNQRAAYMQARETRQQMAQQAVGLLRGRLQQPAGR